MENLKQLPPNQNLVHLVHLPINRVLPGEQAGAQIHQYADGNTVEISQGPALTIPSFSAQSQLAQFKPRTPWTTCYAPAEYAKNVPVFPKNVAVIVGAIINLKMAPKRVVCVKRAVPTSIASSAVIANSNKGRAGRETGPIWPTCTSPRSPRPWCPLRSMSNPRNNRNWNLSTQLTWHNYQWAHYGHSLPVQHHSTMNLTPPSPHHLTWNLLSITVNLQIW